MSILREDDFNKNTQARKKDQDVKRSVEIVRMVTELLPRCSQRSVGRASSFTTWCK